VRLEGAAIYFSRSDADWPIFWTVRLAAYRTATREGGESALDYKTVRL